jgi:glycosyltransferase involved in cell wall biosynthesis
MTRQQSIIMPRRRHQITSHHEPWLGGPGTLLPFHVEAGLAWILALGLLSVSGYHYVVETLVKPYWTKRMQTTTSTISPFTIFCYRRCSLMWQPVSFFFSCATIQTTTAAARPKTSPSSSTLLLPCWLPLTTYSRSEVDRATPQERLQQLANLLQELSAANTTQEAEAKSAHKKQPRTVATKRQQQGEETTLASSSSSYLTWNDQQLITIMRGSVVLRRLASLAMRPSTVRDAHVGTSGSSTTASQCDASASASALRLQLVRIWPALLRLPPEQDDDDHEQYSFEISLVIACFRERPSDVRLKLRHALNMARCPLKIQVVLVDAGGNGSSDNGTKTCGLQQVASEETMRCNGSSSSSSSSSKHGADRGTGSNSHGSDFSTTTPTTTTSAVHQHCWGSIKIVDFCERQQGRGPALNAGAAHSTGRILAFLHSDTKLPVDWDVKLRDAFHSDGSNDGTCTPNDNNNSSRPRCRLRANAAAFGFGIDMNGLNKHHRCTIDDYDYDDDSHYDSYYPPGLRAVQMTANLRCQLWSLPYGDQCLCLPRRIFNHMGGYPHQCFMEDYELISLLRRRQALVHTFFCNPGESSSSTATTTTIMAPTLEPEALKIIPGPSALCSPRRWQRLGVLYVTYMNSLLVNSYHAHDLTPQDLYKRYYGHALNGWHDLAPWELELSRADLVQGAIKQPK